MPQHLNVVGPKLCLKVVGAKLSLSRNFAHHSKFRVCVRTAQPTAAPSATFSRAALGSGGQLRIASPFKLMLTMQVAPEEP